MRLIKTGYEARPQFVPFHTRQQRFAVIVAHRRAGKTVACVNDLIDGALRCDKPSPRFAYIAPTYTQAKDVAWEYVKHYTAPIPGVEQNESELRVDLPRGARVRLYGAENAERLRGLYLDGVVLDEYALMKPGVWGEIIRPALSDREGWACFIGTPMGRNQFWDVWNQAARENWTRIMLKASETGIIRKEELEAARLDMTPEQYEQEYECSFDAAIQGAYYGKDIAEAERDGRVRKVPYDKSVPVHTAWDLGVGDATAIWFWQAIGSEIHLIDYYESTGVGADHYAKMLQTKPYVYGEHYGPHDAAAREWGTGRTRIEQLKELGLEMRVCPQIGLDDGINAARVTLSRCWFDAEKTERGLEALRQYRTEFDDKLRVFKNKPRHDWTSHAADAFRYMALAWRDKAGVLQRPVIGMDGLTLDRLWSETKRKKERI